MPVRYEDGLPLTKRTAVYSITNTVNGKVYVGSALSLRGRLLYHRSCLRRGCHDNRYLQHAWNKCGERHFQFAVLEFCDPRDLLNHEQYWIDNLDTTDRRKGYNICPVAGSVMTGRTHTAESRAKMSVQRKGIQPVKATAAAAKANKGKKRPDSVRAKIAAGNKGQTRSEETRAKIKANHWRNRPDAEEIIEKTASKNRGKNHTEEHRRKISEGNYRDWARRRLKGS